MDVDQHGGWTQIFSSRTSEPETSRQVVKQFSPTPPAFHAPFGVIPLEFHRYLMDHKIQNPWAIVQHGLHDPKCSHFGTTPACDRQTYRQTDMR